jgi:hypothetical protein
VAGWWPRGRLMATWQVDGHVAGWWSRGRLMSPATWQVDGHVGVGGWWSCDMFMAKGRLRVGSWSSYTTLIQLPAADCCVCTTLLLCLADILSHSPLAMTYCRLKTSRSSVHNTPALSGVYIGEVFNLAIWWFLSRSPSLMSLNTKLSINALANMNCNHQLKF